MKKAFAKRFVNLSRVDSPYANPTSSGHAARLVLMSCYLYYWCESPVLFDANYDVVCAYLAGRWDKLKPIRRHMLGSAEDILATGHHVLVSKAVEGGAREWHKATRGSYPARGPLPDSSWKFNKRFNLRLAPLV